MFGVNARAGCCSWVGCVGFRGIPYPNLKQWQVLESTIFSRIIEGSPQTRLPGQAGCGLALDCYEFG